MPLLLLLGVAFVSAFVPVVNLEAYLAAQVALVPGGMATTAAVAALGQMIGKAIWFELGTNITRVPWLEKKVASPKASRRREELRVRLAGHPWTTAATLFASASTGIPPFAIMAILAGDLRVPRPVFWTTGFLGRFLRFLATLGAAHYVVALLR